MRRINVSSDKIGVPPCGLRSEIKIAFCHFSLHSEIVVMHHRRHDFVAFFFLSSSVVIRVMDLQTKTHRPQRFSTRIFQRKQKRCFVFLTF